MTRKTIALVPIIAWLAASAGLAQDMPQPEGPTSNGNHKVYHQPVPTDPSALVGKIVFEKTAHDFGHIVDTEPVTTEFPFRNDGPGDLVINSINSTCGCTVPELSKTIYKPGESGAIAITFNPSGKHQANTKRISVQCNDREQPTVVLQVSSFVEQLIAFDPPFLSFGNLRKGEVQSRVIAVTGRTPDFAITDVALIGDAALSAVILGSEDVVLSDGARGRRVEIEITVDGTAKPGALRGNLEATTTEARREKVNTSLTGVVLGDVSTDVERLPMGVLNPGKTFERVVRLESRQGKPFTFLGAELKAPIGESQVNWDVIQPADSAEQGPREVYDVKVIVTAGSKPGPLRGALVFKTDVPEEEQIEIPFWGTIRLEKR